MERFSGAKHDAVNSVNSRFQLYALERLQTEINGKRQVIRQLVSWTKTQTLHRHIRERVSCLLPALEDQLIEFQCGGSG